MKKGKRPEYLKKEFREVLRQVHKRDRHTCRFPGCKSRKKIQVHHIKRYADFPELREKAINLICLCRKHHELVKNKEDQYAPLFFSIINKMDRETKEKLHKMKKEDDRNQ